jgi:excinuclease ABC subunit B
MFKVVSSFKPTGDQPEAIKQLVGGVRQGLKNQVLLGVTGSGKTFTMAKVIEELQTPALIISHNKTLAGQLYQEFRDFFPNNGVSYFVSYYDYYQPEAYIPSTDTYIEKEAQINQLIDKLRLQATTNILTRRDTIVVASVSCIYNIGSPTEYGKFVTEIKKNQPINEDELLKKLIELQYQRSEFDFKRGTFRHRGNYLDLYLAYEDFGYRIYFEDAKIKQLEKIDPLTGKILESDLSTILVYPAKHYLANLTGFDEIEREIRNDLKKESDELNKKGKLLEAERLIRRVNYDLEMIKEVGYVNGIENYSRYFDGRKPGDRPYSLLDFFIEAYGDNWLLFIDESHMTIPQLRGMYHGDYSRKKMLVDHGFRLKAAFDNRPLKFEEFYPLPRHIIYVSATPDEWEINQVKNELSQKRINLKGIVEQLIRPTGIVDPEVIIRPAKNEVQDLLIEIEKRVNKKEKVLVTTLTKRMAEDLTDYLKEKNIKAAYLHSDIKTLERSDLLDKLRKGEFDVIVGINLLREGLDLPEVSLVAILDADREGFLRSRISLIQTMGRAARNVLGQVIIYADQITKSIKEAVSEINRRREYQLEYNKKHGIIPKTIYKPIREKIIAPDEEIDLFDKLNKKESYNLLNKINKNSLTPFDKAKLIKKLERMLRQAVEEMNFELAIELRDTIKSLKKEND